MPERNAEIGFSFTCPDTSIGAVTEGLKGFKVGLVQTPIAAEFKAWNISGKCIAGEEPKVVGALASLGDSEVLRALVEFEDLSRRTQLEYGGLMRTVWYRAVRSALPTEVIEY